MNSKFICLAITVLLITTVLTACSKKTEPVEPTESVDSTLSENVDNSNNSGDFTLKEISDFTFAVPTGYSVERSSNGSTICNEKVFILATTSEYDNCDSYDKVVEITKKTAMNGIYSAFGISSEDMIVSSSKNQSNKNGMEMLKVEGYFISSEKKTKFIAYYSIVDGINGKYPVYWIGISNGTSDMTEVTSTTNTIAENFSKVK